MFFARRQREFLFGFSEGLPHRNGEFPLYRCASTLGLPSGVCGIPGAEEEREASRRLARRNRRDEQSPRRCMSTSVRPRRLAECAVRAQCGGRKRRAGDCGRRRRADDAFADGMVARSQPRWWECGSDVWRGCELKVVCRARRQLEEEEDDERGATTTSLRGAKPALAVERVLTCAPVSACNDPPTRGQRTAQHELG